MDGRPQNLHGSLNNFHRHVTLVRQAPDKIAWLDLFRTGFVAYGETGVVSEEDECRECVRDLRFPLALDQCGAW